MTLQEWIYYGPMALSYAGTACVFYWMAMEWQRRQENCFFFLALSCGLNILIGVIDQVAAQQQLSEAEYWGFWGCRQTAVVLEAFLFTYGIWRLVKYLKKAIVPTASPEGLDSAKEIQ